MEIEIETRHKAYKYALEQFYIEVAEILDPSPCIHIRDGAGFSELDFHYLLTPKYFPEFAAFLPCGRDCFICDDAKDLNRVEIALLFMIEMSNSKNN